MSKPLREIPPAQLSERHQLNFEAANNPLLEGNHLLQRWQALDTQTSTHFVIIETHFGAGHHFLAAAALWLQSAPLTAKLHFIAFEAAPLSRADLKQALDQVAPDSKLAAQLIKHYPALSPGFHRLFFADQRICLSLIFIDADTTLDQSLAFLKSSCHPGAQHLKPFKVDAWFLSSTLTQAMCAQLQYFSAAETTLVNLITDKATQNHLEAIGFTLNTTNDPFDKPSLLYGQWQAPKTVIQTVLEKQKKITASTPLVYLLCHPPLSLTTCKCGRWRHCRLYHCSSTRPARLASLFVRTTQQPCQ